ncbi:Hypothetical protein HVR_LOCUS130 [uncultured virus]|nr:Hypothetical protein HVR_LOCUS130 [uncultured virus]
MANPNFFMWCWKFHEMANEQIDQYDKWLQIYHESTNGKIQQDELIKYEDAIKQHNDGWRKIHEWQQIYHKLINKRVRRDGLIKYEDAKSLVENKSTQLNGSILGKRKEPEPDTNE